MTNLTLIRFGQSPSPEVSAALAPHIIGKAVALPIPGAILSIFKSNSTMDEVRDSIAQTGAMFILSESTEMVLPQPLMDAIIKVFKGAAPVLEDKPLTMDEILDLISQNGIESLTPAQKQQLENLR
jgi:hypothetical protein